MSPYELGVMLHYYAHIDDHESFVRNPPIWKETHDRFIADGLLEVTPKDEMRDAVLRITPKGRAFVEALQRVPLPRSVWVVEWPDLRQPLDPQMLRARNQIIENCEAILNR